MLIWEEQGFLIDLFNMRNLSCRKGFTLTELLVVVIIVAILAVLALPMLVKTLEKAKVGEATSNLNLIRTGQKIYFLENNTFTNSLNTLNIESPNDQEDRYFYYEASSSADTLTDDFTAKAVRGGAGAKSASSTYQDDLYTIQKKGTIVGRFTDGTVQKEP